MSFWDFRTSRERDQERIVQHQRDHIRSLSKPLTSVLDKRRAEVDDYEAKVRGFIEDIDAIFARVRMEHFLTDRYSLETKFDGLEPGERRLAMKWRAEANGIAYELAFCFVETKAFLNSDRHIRIDYIADIGPPTWDRNNPLLRADPNPNYDGTGEDVHVFTKKLHDKFQSTRQYDTYAEFQNAKAVPPKWFINLMLDHIPAI